MAARHRIVQRLTILHIVSERRCQLLLIHQVLVEPVDGGAVVLFVLCQLKGTSGLVLRIILFAIVTCLDFDEIL